LRVGIAEARRKRIARSRLEDDGAADPPFVHLSFCGRVAGIEPAHEAHLKERSGPRFRFGRLDRFGQRDGGRLLAECRLLRVERMNDDVAVRVRRTDDDDRVHLRIGNQGGRIGVRAPGVELARSPLGQRAVGVGDRDERRRRDPRAQIARVHATETAEPYQSNVQPRHYLSPLVTSSMRTLTSAGTLSPRSAFTAFSTATRPISSGNCATDATMAPSAMAFRASSTASKPTTRIDPTRGAARIASTAPSAIMSLQANTVSMSAWACSMFWNTLKP